MKIRLRIQNGWLLVQNLKLDFKSNEFDSNSEFRTYLLISLIRDFTRSKAGFIPQLQSISCIGTELNTMEVITLEEEENNVWLIHGHKFKYIFCDIDQLTDILFYGHKATQIKLDSWNMWMKTKMAIEIKLVLPWYNFTIFDEIFITGQWSFTQNTFNPINDFDF